MNDEEYLGANLRRDWLLWSQQYDSRGHELFSLCQYPFVYEPAAKATILGMSNFNAQMGEFHDALRESMAWGSRSVPFLVLRVCALSLSPSRPCSACTTEPHAGRRKTGSSYRPSYTTGYPSVWTRLFSS